MTRLHHTSKRGRNATGRRGRVNEAPNTDMASRVAYRTRLGRSPRDYVARREGTSKGAVSYGTATNHLPPAARNPGALRESRERSNNVTQQFGTFAEPFAVHELACTTLPDRVDRSGGPAGNAHPHSGN